MEEELRTLKEKLGATDIMFRTVEEELGATDIKFGTVEEELVAADILVGTVEEELGAAEESGMAGEELGGTLTSSEPKKKTIKFIYMESKYLQEVTSRRQRIHSCKQYKSSSQKSKITEKLCPLL